MKKTGVIFGIIFFVAMTISSALYGQFVSSGGVSGKVKWMEAKGDTYSVIYPIDADSLALRYLWLLEQNKSAVMLGLGGIEPAKIPVVLYTGSMRSNGMVVWAPKRMELFTLPALNSYPARWDEQLAVHESRHVGQMTYFTGGIYKLGSFLVGQQAPSLGAAIYPSRWFLEGDAVVAETELTNSGRGRSAEFMEYYRAAFLEGDDRSWAKWKLGSYRYYTPDRYAFGYLIGSTIRYHSGKYGYAGEVLESMVDKFYNPLIIRKSYIGSVGDTRRNYFVKGREMYTTMWQQELQRRGKLTIPRMLLKNAGSSYAEYSSPVKIGRDSILYIKKAYDDFRRLVLVSGGEEKVLAGLSSSVEQVKGAVGKVWFVESVADVRWSNQVYGEIYSYNIVSGKFGRLAAKGYYAHVCPREDGKILQAVAYNPAGGTAVELLDASTGELLANYPAPDNGQITSTAYLNGVVYALCTTGKGLGLFSTSGGEWNRVIQEQSANIEDLGSNGEVLFFLSDMDGVRNVYMYYPHNGELVRGTNAIYGASAPLVTDGKVYYSSLHLNGKLPAVADAYESVDSGSEFAPKLIGGKIEGAYRYIVADQLSAQAGKALQQQGLLASKEEMAERNGTSMVKYAEPYSEFAASVEKRNYGKLGHLFNFHSWGPLYYNVDKIRNGDYDHMYEVVSPGVTLYSQNALGTAVTMLGYSYTKGNHEGHFSMEYSGWYPVVQFTADLKGSGREFYKLKIENSSAKVERSVTDEAVADFKALAYIPFNFSRNGWNRGLVPMLQWEYSNASFYSYETGKFHPSNGITAAVQYYVQRDVAHAGVFPKWGLGGNVMWRGMIDMRENYGSQAALNLYGYLPGFAANHGIKLGVQMQQQYNDDKVFYITNLVGMPRGYTDDVYGQSYVKCSADYAFPVYLGDVAISRLTYLKRMRVVPFADFAVNSVDGEDVTERVGMYSFGTDIIVDMTPFTIDVEFGLGVRYSRNGNDGNIPVPANTWQVLFSTTLF